MEENVYAEFTGAVRSILNSLERKDIDAAKALEEISQTLKWLDARIGKRIIPLPGYTEIND